MAEQGVLKTEHLYLNDSEAYSCESVIAATYDVKHQDVSCIAIVTDSTVMHPQGGGQPSDTGVLTSEDGVVVMEVLFVQKPSKDALFIEHVGQYRSGQFNVGDKVRVTIDSNKRRFHARLHSAGHLLDAAFVNIGWNELVPTKGYHFPSGSYVEYVGEIPADKREGVVQQLNEEVKRLIESKSAVGVATNEKGERIVTVGGVSCPCGGTHVKNVADIRAVTVTKIKKSKTSVRVSYSLEQ